MDKKIGKQQIKNIFRCNSPQNGELGINKKNIVLHVEKIEPCLKFWVDALGFKKKNSAASRKSLNVIVLSSGNAEIRLETYTNLEKKDPGRADKVFGMPPLVLYLEVMDIEDVESRLKDFDIIIKSYTMGNFGFRWNDFRNGDNSGFCAVQMAILLGYKDIRLVGMDFNVGNLSHFHRGYGEPKYKFERKLNEYYRIFSHAIQNLKNKRKDIQIYNCSSLSRLNELLPYKPI